MVFFFGIEHCRVCFVKPKKSRCIDESEEDGEEAPIDMMQKLIGTELITNVENLDIPQRICKSCHLSLDLAFQFRSKVLKAERIINAYIKKHHNAMENAQVTEDESEEILIQMNSADDTDVEIVEEIHPEDPLINYNKQTDEFDLNKQTIEIDTTMEDEEYLEECEELEFMIAYDGQDESNMKEDTEKQHIYIVNDEDINSIYSQTPTISKIVQQKEKPQNKVVEQQQVRQTKSVKKKEDTNIMGRKYEVAEGQMLYICDICGNGFDKRTRMMDHRRRHTKELVFACEICDERFHLRESMKRHMFTHRGDRPYKCSHCSRSFYYESVRKTHELVHIGVKPYVCNVCSKPFAYAHALKKHQMIHDEVKLYNCEYCKKEFRLQHHLKQHEETKTHQNAVAQALENKKPAEVVQNFCTIETI